MWGTAQGPQANPQRVARPDAGVLSHELLPKLVEHAPVAICMVGGSGMRIELANATCRQLTASHRPVGESLLEMLPACANAIRTSHEAQSALRAGRAWVLPEHGLHRCASGAYVDSSWNWVLWPLSVVGGAHFVLMGYEVIAQVCARDASVAARAQADRQQREDCLAQLMHELRGPLAPISAALELLAISDPSLHDRARTVLDRQIKHLLRLVNDLLDIAREGPGAFRLQYQRVQLATIVDQAVELAAPAIRERRHGLTLDIAHELFVEVDPVRLVQVIANLVINAAKYTQEGGSICVFAHLTAGELVLCVRDNGVGIAAEVLPHIFDMFVRGTGAGACDGLGLGLYIVRTLVRQHGGSIEARSDGRGRGSEFIVRLPCERCSDDT
jgi:signal transduction histidine kinase